MTKCNCNVPKCNRTSDALGMCNKHYQRHHYGKPMDDKPIYEFCTVEGCNKKPRSTHAELCAMHYHRVYRNGTLEVLELSPKWDDITGQRYGTLTPIRRDGNFWLCQCDCGETRVASTGELNRTGEGNTCGIPGRHLDPAPTYSAAHERVKQLHGPARLHNCVGCGEPAKHWSYNHDDPNELFEEGLSKNAIAYSADPSHYSPRCVPCHKRFDLQQMGAAPHHASEWAA